MRLRWFCCTLMLLLALSQGALAQGSAFLEDQQPAPPDDLFGGPQLPPVEEQEEAAEQPLKELVQPTSPYISVEGFVSPITGESFNAQILARNPPVSSFDYDGCPHPVINSLAYTLVIDPQTGYVAYPSVFNRPVKLKREQLLGILGQPKFGHEGDAGPWDGAYAWEKFENAARLAKAGRSGNLAEGYWWQQAAWSVRLDVIGGGNSFDSEVDKLFTGLPAEALSLSPALSLEQSVPYELRLAEQLQSMRSIGDMVNVAPDDYALALAWLYRSRGELEATRYWLGQAREAGSAGEGTLYSFLNSSTNLESEYLQQALSAFMRGWEAGELQPNERAAAAFAIAEMHRRLGQRRSAALWFAEAFNRNRGEISRPLLERLYGLCFERGW
ncbi:DUF2225 domain-containing protein [bacterium]|nr:DUF2225 domain-containing protein [bacterium]